MIKRLTFTIIATLLCIGYSSAVTPQEMEQAQATTALWYLRYVNNGSDYLEKLSPKTIDELQQKLRSKEKENIKAFLTVSIPEDYQSWDKSQLVEFWSNTIFSNPNFPEKAKEAKSRIRAKLNAMQISAPAQQPSETAIVEPQPTDSIVPETSPTQAQQILEEQSAETPDTIEIDNPEDEQQENNSNMTWLYITILIVLIGIVVWLVVYAVNSMKKNNLATPATSSDSTTTKFAEELEKKDREIAELKEKLQALTIKLRAAENKSAKPISTQYTGRKISPQNPRTIYLAQANNQGIFVRADAEYNMGNSIFKLITTDGVSGSFTIIEDSNVFELALMMPVDFLINACSGKNLQIAQGMKSIVTDNAGTAIFENGKWKVIRKAEIHYEK